MAKKLEIGDVNNSKMIFKVASTGALADPVAVTVEIKPPKLTAKLTYVYGASGSPVVKVAVGIYTVPIHFNDDGPWTVIWTGAGAGSVEASASAVAVVVPRPFT